ncbi:MULTISPECIES: hypothetical protein [unclassified Clostridium]|uniref:hypothetical protein n=1 Tax=unclassified Clostridium TaxID=2614128 RepID=UPI002079E129|nr:MULTISPECIES: hypothetical protein [unclassified Clostridium]
MEQKKPIFNLEQLEENVNMFIIEEKSNLKLINQITMDFGKKGLRIQKPKLLFENNAEWKDLSEQEKIAFITSAYDYFNNVLKSDIKMKQEHVKNICPTLYFYRNKIDENQMLQPEQRKTNDILVFENVTKLNEKEFTTFLTAKQLSNMKKDGKIVYLKDVQRASKRTVLPNGTVILRENYNKDGLKQLEKRFLKQDILSTQITFTIIVWKGKTPNIDFDVQCNNIFGELIFKPNFDMNSSDYAFLNIADGAHRMNGLINAYDKDNSIADEKLSVAIKVVTLEEAKQLINDSFQANETDKLYIETMNNTPINKYVDNIIDNCIFKDRIAKTLQEESMEEMYASFGMLKDIVNLLRIDLSSDLMSSIDSKKIARIIDSLVEIISTKFDNSIKNIKSDSCLLDKNMCVIYVNIANYLKDKTDEELLEMALFLVDNQEKIKEILKLNNVTKIINEFNKLSGVK